MSPGEFALIFGLGLAASLHCVQMCGPIVLAYSLPLAGSRGRMARAHLAYNAGRIATYTFLGALAGGAGGALGMMGRLAGVQNGARLIAGGLMVLAGIVMAVPRSGLVRIQGPASWLGRSYRRLAAFGKFPLGLAFGFLPCGLVYGALLKAVETGSLAGGALTMLAFGLGTAGALVAIGFASSAVGPRLGAWSTRIAALGISLGGGWLIWRALAAGAVHHCH